MLAVVCSIALWRAASLGWALFASPPSNLYTPLSTSPPGYLLLLGFSVQRPTNLYPWDTPFHPPGRRRYNVTNYKTLHSNFHRIDQQLALHVGSALYGIHGRLLLLTHTGVFRLFDKKTTKRGVLGWVGSAWTVFGLGIRRWISFVGGLASTPHVG
ncbi:hypothetical protein HDK90DRAFT_174082 [Phyllosticta capitalensis]|uniref:Uncharacterized protein n=1 Tax=Phyllosticta capitalensis TaxID=121624 RepID=A0ABR1YWA8_9PEZI